MTDDYRSTKYCPELKELRNKKKELVKDIKTSHPRAVDMHNYIRKNDEHYKKQFMKIYNNKCAYCGVSVDLLPRELFEVDHFIYKKSPKFESKKYAGCINNLVLACHECNYNKRSFDIADDEYKLLHPDGEEIKDIFYRDENYYIKLSNASKNNRKIRLFYEQLHLGGETHRLDFFLMNLIGFQKRHEENGEVYMAVGKIINIMRSKRNMT